MIISEDKIILYNFKYQVEVFSLYNIFYLLWLKNFPDLNIIKPYRFQLEKKTYKNSLLKIRNNW